jgi:flagellar protein FlaG
MLAEAINITRPNPVPLAQPRPPEVDEPTEGNEPAEGNKPAPRGSEAQTEPNLSDLTEVAADVQKNLNMIHNVDLQFTVHKASGRTMVQVTDADTGEVIREIPPEEILNLAARLDEMVGLIFDQKG